MNYNSLLKKSWEQLIKNIVIWIIFFILGGLLSCTIVLIPTVAAGTARALLAYVREGKEPEFSQLWNFENYLQMLLLAIVLSLLIIIGYLLFFIPGVILTIWWLYAVFFLVDKKMSFWPAMAASKEAVSRTGFRNHFLVFLILIGLNWAGALAFGLGALITFPFSYLFLTNIYLQINGEKAL